MDIGTILILSHCLCFISESLSLDSVWCNRLPLHLKNYPATLIFSSNKSPTEAESKLVLAQNFEKAPYQRINVGWGVNCECRLPLCISGSICRICRIRIRGGSVQPAHCIEKPVCFSHKWKTNNSIFVSRRGPCATLRAIACSRLGRLVIIKWKLVFSWKWAFSLHCLLVHVFFECMNCASVCICAPEFCIPFLVFGRKSACAWVLAETNRICPYNFDCKKRVHAAL